MSTSQRTLALGSGTLELLQGDITRCAVDAIVNAANRELQVGAGVCGAIHRKGGRAIEEECAGLREERGGCATGAAVITTAGRLPARHVLHAVGPIWRGGQQEEARLLASCYHACGALAREFQLESVAFPAISTGIYGYPLKPAARVALVATAEEVLEGPYPRRVVHVLFDPETYAAYDAVLDELELTGALS